MHDRDVALLAERAAQQALRDLAGLLDDAETMELDDAQTCTCGTHELVAEVLRHIATLARQRSHAIRVEVIPARSRPPAGVRFAGHVAAVLLLSTGLALLAAAGVGAWWLVTLLWTVIA